MPVGSAGGDALSAARAAPRAASRGPRYWPKIWSVGLVAAGGERQSVVSSSGAFGAQRCQAGRSRRPADHGQWRRSTRRVAPATCRRRKSVTIPKLPPPPPRHAQKRSALCRASQVSSRPSAVTIRATTTLSRGRPELRATRGRSPPPSARPPMPTVGHEPAGIVAPLRGERGVDVDQPRARRRSTAVPPVDADPAQRRRGRRTTPVPVEQPA